MSMDYILKFKKDLIAKCYNDYDIIKSRSHKYIKKITDKNGKTRYIYEQKKSTIRTAQRPINSRYAAQQLRELRYWMATTNDGRALGGEAFKKVYEFFNRRASERLYGATSNEDRDFIDVDISQKEEQTAVIEFAKQNGLWYDLQQIESVSGPQSRKVGEGIESVVYNYGNDSVLKVMSTFDVKDLQYPIESMVRRIAIFNQIFNNSAYNFVGFTLKDDDNGVSKVHLLVTQRFFAHIKNGIEQARQQIVQQFKLKQPYKDNPYMYYNKHFIIDDLHLSNVVMSDDIPVVVDCRVELNTEQGWDNLGENKPIDSDEW